MAEDPQRDAAQPGESAVFTGVGGLPLVGERRSTNDVRLLARAIRNGWPIKEEYKSEIIDELFLQATCGEEPTTRIAAARAVIAADAINARREATETAAQREPSSVNVQVNVVQNAVREAMNHPEYLEFLERRAVAEDSDPGAVREDGEPVQDGSPPRADIAVVGQGG